MTREEYIVEIAEKIEGMKEKKYLYIWYNKSNSFLSKLSCW